MSKHKWRVFPEMMLQWCYPKDLCMVCMAYLATFGWFFMVNVGKYTGLQKIISYEYTTTSRNLHRLLGHHKVTNLTSKMCFNLDLPIIGKMVGTFGMVTLIIKPKNTLYSECLFDISLWSKQLHFLSVCETIQPSASLLVGWFAEAKEGQNPKTELIAFSRST